MEAAVMRSLISEEDYHLVDELLKPRQDHVPMGWGKRGPGEGEFWIRMRQRVLIIWDSCKALASDAEKAFIERVKTTRLLAEARERVQPYYPPARKEKDEPLPSPPIRAYLGIPRHPMDVERAD